MRQPRRETPLTARAPAPSSSRKNAFRYAGRLPRAAAMLLMLCLQLPALATTELRILSMHGGDVPKAGLRYVVESFQAQNPDVRVTIETIEHEAFKTKARAILQEPRTDIITWHAGNRARVLAEKGLLEPLDDAGIDKEAFSAGMLRSVVFNERLYGLPYAYYHWTLYFNKQAFARAGIKEPPRNWSELLAAVGKLRAAGLTPIALPTRESWPAGGWLDLIGMSTYGFEEHMRLCRGETSYTSASIRPLFDHWTELVKRQAFGADHRDLRWQDAAQQLLDGKAAMMLQGNFWIAEMKVGANAGIESMQFPVIDPKHGTSSIAPTDILAVSAKSANKVAAKRFMAFAARSDIQEGMNQILKILPANAKARFDDKDPFAAFGARLLERTAGISQFYDREADPEVARVGMSVMVNLVDHPEKLDSEVARLEDTRRRIHRK